MLYAIVILVSMTIIAIVNIIIDSGLYEIGVLNIIVAVVLSTVCVIIVDLIFAFIVNKFPERWVSSDKRIFDVSQKEKQLYEKLQIRKWKDKILELGKLKNFRKNKVAEPENNEYVSKFLIECNYGIIVHIACIFFGFAIIFIFPLKYALMFGVPVAFVNAVLNLLPLFVLRYNIPRLKVLYKRNLRNEQRMSQLTNLANQKEN